MELKKLTRASLFSGIGACELAADRCDWVNVFNCEINPFCREVLRYWFPETINYGDISKTDFTPWHGKIDVLTGGFPCQPFSCAGKRKGANDDRYLWPEMLRAIAEIQPSYVVGENVAGILSMVQPGSEIAMGRSQSMFGESNDIYERRQRFAADSICESLEHEGYAVMPLTIPACAVGAPHRRDRVWFIAKRVTADGTDTRSEDMRQKGEDTILSARNATDTDQHRFRNGKDQSFPLSECESPSDDCPCCKDGIAPNADARKLERFLLAPRTDEKRRQDADGSVEKPSSNDRQLPPADRWKNFPTQSPVCGRDDGLPFDVDCLSLSFSRWRQESIKAYGNSMVPQVVIELFQAIEKDLINDMNK